MHSKSQRQSRIRDLIESQPVGSQEQLQKLLVQSGIRATQATLSRDLREMGVLKGPLGYRLPGVGFADSKQTRPDELARALQEFMRSCKAAGHLVVIRTGTGQAQMVALELDRARLSEVLGTVAGDDTIFIAARSGAEGTRLASQLRKLAGAG